MTGGGPQQANYGHFGYNQGNPCALFRLRFFKWCPSRDSNPDAVKHRLLRPACLPIPPPGQSAETEKTHALALWGKHRIHLCTQPVLKRFARSQGCPRSQPLFVGVMFSVETCREGHLRPNLRLGWQRWRPKNRAVPLNVDVGYMTHMGRRAIDGQGRKYDGWREQGHGL